MAGGERLAELLAVGVVLHLAGLGVRVIDDAAVGGDPGEAQLRAVQAVEILGALDLHGAGGQFGLQVELVGLLAGKVAVERAGYQQQAGGQHHEGHQEYGTEDLFLHVSASRR